MTAAVVHDGDETVDNTFEFEIVMKSATTCAAIRRATSLLLAMVENTTFHAVDKKIEIVVTVTVRH